METSEGFLVGETRDTLVRLPYRCVGVGPVQFLAITKSCQCIEVRTDKRQVSSGESGEISFVVNLDGTTRNREVALDFVYESKGRKFRHRITHVVQQRPLVDVKPGRLELTARPAKDGDQIQLAGGITLMQYTRPGVDFAELEPFEIYGDIEIAEDSGWAAPVDEQPIFLRRERAIVFAVKDGTVTEHGTAVFRTACVCDRQQCIDLPITWAVPVPIMTEPFALVLTRERPACEMKVRGKKEAPNIWSFSAPVPLRIVDNGCVDGEASARSVTISMDLDAEDGGVSRSENIQFTIEHDGKVIELKKRVFLLLRPES